MTIKKLVAVAGVANLLTYLLYAGTSYLAAPAAGFAERPYGQLAFHLDIGERAAAVVEWARAGFASPDAVRLLSGWNAIMALTGEGPYGDPIRFSLLYAIPLAIATLITLGLLVALARRPQGSEPADDVARSVLHWSIGFAVVVAVSLPVLDPSFWLATAWARVPLPPGPYAPMSPSAAIGLPLDSPLPSATLGPAWLLVAGVIRRLTSWSVVYSAVAWKLVDAAAWTIALIGVARLARPLDSRARAMVMLLAGWLPVGVITFVGEGRPEVIAVALTAVGLSFRSRLATTLALSAATLTVPLIAPLMVLMAARPSADGARARDAVGRVALGAAIVALGILIVPGGAQWARAAVDLGTGSGLAGRGVGVVLAAAPPIAGVIARLGTLALVAWLWLNLRRSREAREPMLAAGAAALLLLAVPAWIWPTGIAWAMPLVVVNQPASSLAKWVVALAVAAPLLPVLPAAFPGRRPGITLEAPVACLVALAATTVLFTTSAARALRLDANASAINSGTPA